MALSIDKELQSHEILSQIQNMFQCRLCSDTLTSPVQVQCSHIFCSGCVGKLGMKKGPRTCPDCKCKFNPRIQKPREDFQDLFQAFNHLVAAFQSGRKKSLKSDVGTNISVCVDEDEDEDEDETMEVVDTLAAPSGTDIVNAVTLVNSTPLPNGSSENEEGELFILTQAVSLKLPPAKSNHAKDGSPLDDRTPTSIFGQKVNNNVLPRVRGSPARKIGARESEEEQGKPLDLSVKLTSQQARLVKLPRYAFAHVDPSLALDLSCNSSSSSRKKTKTGRIGEGLEIVNALYPRKKPILNPVRYYHIYANHEANYHSGGTTLTMSEKPEEPLDPACISKPSSQNHPLSLVEGSKTACTESESSDKILCQALDELVSQERVPESNSDNFMPSGEDAILYEAENVAAVFGSAPSTKSNSSTKRANSVDEESTSDSIEKRLKLADEGGRMEVVEVQKENNQDQGMADDSDNESEDMFLFQTPESPKGSPIKNSYFPNSPSSMQNPNPSSPLKLSNPNGDPNTTPASASVFCTSPPSGALSKTIGNISVDNYDPFADDLGEIPYSEVADENQSGRTTSKVQLEVLTFQQQSFAGHTSQTPKKLDRKQVEARTPDAGNKFGRINSSGSLKDVSTPKQWRSPSRQNYLSPSRSLLDRSQRDKQYLAALSPKTPAKAPKSFVFCPTRLSSLQINQLRKLCGMCGGRILREFDDEVTHLILTLEDGRVPQTMKYLFAIAGKKWVLTFDWVEDCIRQNKLVREEMYETSNFKGCDVGVRESRLAKVPLFEGYAFHVLGNFSSSGAKDSDWRRLLRKLGATIVADVNEVTRGTIVVGDSSDFSVDYQKLFTVHKVVTVAWEWILDCVLNYTVLPISKTEYLVTQIHSDEMRESGIPPALLPEI